MSLPAAATLPSRRTAASRPVWKLQRSLDRLELRLVAERIEEEVNFRVREIRVATSKA
jgi:seryl-tRNA(Sec) selenium transferase